MKRFGESLQRLVCAVHGHEVIGRDRYGAFPLRGKILNVPKQSTCEEITRLLKLVAALAFEYAVRFRQADKYLLRQGPRCKLCPDNEQVAQFEASVLKEEAAELIVCCCC